MTNWFPLNQSPADAAWLCSWVVLVSLRTLALGYVLGSAVAVGHGGWDPRGRGHALARHTRAGLPWATGVLVAAAIGSFAVGAGLPAAGEEFWAVAFSGGRFFASASAPGLWAVVLAVALAVPAWPTLIGWQLVAAHGGGCQVSEAAVRAARRVNALGLWTATVCAACHAGWLWQSPPEVRDILLQESAQPAVCGAALGQLGLMAIWAVHWGRPCHCPRLMTAVTTGTLLATTATVTLAAMLKFAC